MVQGRRACRLLSNTDPRHFAVDFTDDFRRRFFNRKKKQRRLRVVVFAVKDAAVRLGLSELQRASGPLSDTDIQGITCVKGRGVPRCNHSRNYAHTLEQKKEETDKTTKKNRNELRKQYLLVSVEEEQLVSDTTDGALLAAEEARNAAGFLLLSRITSGVSSVHSSSNL